MQKVISNLVSGVIILLDKSIKPGDVIEIDIPGKRIDVRLTTAELAARKNAFVPKRKQLKGYLARYAKNVTSASTGALIR